MRAIGIAFVVASCVAACSSHKTPRPPELGDCIPGPGVKCSNPIAIGGSASGPGDGGAQSASDAGPDANGCGAADSLLAQMNGCLPCVAASADCCAADQACTGTCASLLACAQSCMQGDQVCLGACENNWPTGLRAYQALAQCLMQECGSQCPVLAQ